jgi:3',5'-cyclic AMP phosphodiesterase CpdA
LRHRLIVVADPQVYFESELDSVRRAAADIAATASDGIPTVGLVVGDIIGDISHTPSLFLPVKQALEESGIRFFYVAGNHDLDIDARSDSDYARRTFNSIFGPSRYSFDIGRVHYVILDDTFILSRGIARYVGYIDEEQLQWLEKDLTDVPKGSTVVVGLHIPTWSREAGRGEWGKEALGKVVNNREALYNILKPYNVHIMSGHEHYNENYRPTPNIYEHVHAPLSTYFWQTPLSMDGVPAGYAVYEFDGDSISWYYKAVDYSRNRQFNAHGVGEDRYKPQAVTVNVWNYDPKWRVEWYENGEYRGPMTRYTGLDESLAEYVEHHRDQIIYTWLGPAPTDHLFYAVPTSPDSAVRIEVRDRFGNLSVWENNF